MISDTKTNNELALLMKMNSVFDAWLGAQVTVDAMAMGDRYVAVALCFAG